MVGEHATNGPIVVSTGGVTVTAPELFTLRPWPDPRDATQLGAPVFFHGPQPGTPKVRAGGSARARRARTPEAQTLTVPRLARIGLLCG